MKIKNIILIFLISIKLSFGEKILTWQDCVKIAQEKNLNLIINKYDVEISELDKKAAFSKFLPKVETGFNIAKSKFNNTDFKNSYSFRISANQLLFDGLKSIYSYKYYKEMVNLAKYNYEVLSATTRLNLRLAFLELLRYQYLLKINEEIIKRRKQSYELVKIKYQNGREHKGSLLVLEANLAQAEYELKQTLRRIESARKKLAYLLNLNETNSFILKEELEVTNNLELKEPDFNEILLKHPLLKVSQSRLESARLKLKSAKSDFLPQIYFNTSFTRSGETLSLDDKSITFGLSISLSLFEGGLKIINLSKARNDLIKTELEEVNQKNELLYNLENSWLEYQDAIENLRVQKKFLEASEVRAKISFTQYSAGLISFDNWTIIEDELARAKKAFLDAQINVHIKYAYWIYAKGGLLNEI